MAFFDNLRAAIAAVVRPNGRRAITGANLQATLFTMIDGMGQGMQYLGIATPDTIPGTPDFPAYYLAGFNADDTHGAWTPEAFGLDQDVAPGAILRWTGSEWVEVANPLGLLLNVSVYELDIAIRAKYTKPASGIPRSDMSAAVQDALDAGARAEDGVTELRTLVPTQASEQNQLADKNFVNSSIQTQTAHFRGNYESVAALPRTGSGYAGGTPTNNDYMVIQDTTGKQSHEPSPLYDETGAYVVGDIRVAENDLGDLSFFLCTADNDYDDPKPPVTSPDYWEELAWWPAAAGGTWRFKYSGVWADDGVQGWYPEYQVNEEPLTAAQIAALNSNITANLVDKITNAAGVSGNLLGTASQTLTEGQKAQARTNIGATAPEVFWATYGSTTHAEVAAAVSAGKVVMMRYNNKDYHLVISNTASHFYFSCLDGDLLHRISLTTGDAWGAEITIRAQQVANLVASWQATPDNNHYPAEKLVYDSLGKRGVISQTQTWTRAADGGSDYAMGDLVFGLIPQANIDLFESAGATFNETTGYFELNGLTDLSYEEMQKVMRYDLQNQAPVGNYKLRARTNLAPDVTRYYQNYYTWNAYAFNNNNSTCEVLNLGAEGEENISWKRFFYVSDGGTVLFMSNNHHVKSVYGVIDLENVPNINAGFFQNCESLERILLYMVKVNLSSLAGSPRLSLASIVFMVENATNTSAISITLHATAYARCVADTTEYTYQGNTYTGIVAYANAKQITIASA